MIPIPLRVGGAFMSLAVVLIVQAVVAFISGGIFEITVGSVLVWVAALIFGAFATQRRDQPGSRSQVIALVTALVLIIISVVTPTIVLTTTAAYWIAAYAAMAVVCALILRRSIA
ncbi:hypothetical protein [Corynebacterium sp.]|uniref:hypothetical protein n=1 Tax=Corynebacterium sp. TaxID=1720 RepID=UPI0037366731